jgi:hypothetical protein
MRRARERRRQFARLHNLVERNTTKPHGDYPGWPWDMVEVAGHHPDWPHLRGWILQCWQWHPRKTNRPHWLVDGLSVKLLAEVPVGTWLLRRVGDGFVLRGMLSPEDFKEWSTWRPSRVQR